MLLVFVGWAQNNTLSKLSSRLTPLLKTQWHSYWRKTLGFVFGSYPLWGDAGNCALLKIALNGKKKQSHFSNWPEAFRDKITMISHLTERRIETRESTKVARKSLRSDLHSWAVTSTCCQAQDGDANRQRCGRESRDSSLSRTRVTNWWLKTRLVYLGRW